MNKRMSYKKQQLRQHGFTLIEIMVVVVIIGLMATLILPNLLENQDKALKVKSRADLRSLSGQLALYKLDNFSYPTTAEGLQALVSNPGSKPNWRPYLDKKHQDPWGNDYQYLRPGQKNTTRFDLWSFGADGAAGGEGNDKDIGNWDD